MFHSARFSFCTHIKNLVFVDDGDKVGDDRPQGSAFDDLFTLQNYRKFRSKEYLFFNSENYSTFTQKCHNTQNIYLQEPIYTEYL